MWKYEKLTPINTSVGYRFYSKGLFRKKPFSYLIGVIKKGSNFFLNLLANKKIEINPRFFEQTFALVNIVSMLPQKSKVLDIGSAESDIPLYIYAAGYDVTAFDQREYPFIKSVKGDALRLSSYFKKNYFDALTIISTIEHIGLGAYKDPIKNTSYKEILNNWKKVLKKEGIMIITLPITSNEKRLEKNPVQWVYNINNFKDTINQTNGKIFAEKLIIPNDSLPQCWEEVSMDYNNKFNIGVYMCVIIY